METTDNQPAYWQEEILREHQQSKPSLLIDTHRSHEGLRNQPSNTTFHTALVIPDSLGDEAAEPESSERARGDRTDSGYGDEGGPQDRSPESSHAESSHAESTGTSPTPLLKNSALRHKGDLPSDFRRGRRRTKSAASTSKPKKYTPAVPSPTNHQSDHHRHSSSKRPSSKPASRPGSKHSNSGQRSYNIYSKSHSASTSRRSSMNLPERRSENPLTFHYKSSQLFQSLGTALAHHHADPAVHSTVGLVCSSQPSLRHSISASEPYHLVDHSLRHNSESDDAHNEPPSPATPPAPITNISWTSTATRRREYAEIDKSTRGFRGLWARWAPKWCACTHHRPFYNSEKDDDAGSVRRYRLDLPEDEGGVAKGKAPTNQEPSNQEPSNQEPTNQELTNQKLTNQKPTPQELTNREPARSEPINRKPTHDVSRTWSCFNFHDSTAQPNQIGKRRSCIFSSLIHSPEVTTPPREKEPMPSPSPNLSHKLGPVSSQKPASEESSDHKVMRSWSCFSLRSKSTGADSLVKKSSCHFSNLFCGPEDVTEDQSKTPHDDGLANKRSCLFSGLLCGLDDTPEDQHRSTHTDSLVKKSSCLFSGLFCGSEGTASDQRSIEPARIPERPWSSRL